MTQKITVIGAVFDTSGLIVYDSNGKSHEIPQSTTGIEQLVDKMIPVLQKPGGTYELDLDDLTNVSHDTNFHDFQEKNTIGLRFKRIARSVVSTLFGGAKKEESPAPGTYGTVLPTPAEQDKLKPESEPEVDPVVEKQQAAAREIIANAKPITRVTQTRSTEDEVLVATVGDSVIPDADKLRSYIAHSRKINDYAGLQNLILRLSAMIDERKHSVLDVLQFLERGDLPITDRGDILGYKRLYDRQEHMVDPHTQSVTQCIGDFVCIDAKKVDTNRNKECSYGLHVGRRDYMGNFSGDVLCLVMIAPEDLITVPHGDPNKVRVCGYHLLTKLDDDLARQVYAKKPFAEIPKGAELLSKAISGGFGSPQRIVQIMDGRDLDIKNAPEGLIGQTVNRLPDSMTGTKELRSNQKPRKATNVEIPEEQRKPESVPQAKAVSRVQKALTKATDIKLKEKAKAEKATTKPTPAAKPKGKAEQAHELYQALNAAKPADQRASAQALMLFKKNAKKGWEALGFDAEAVERITKLANTEAAPLEDVVTPKKAGGSVRQQKAAELFETYSNRENDTQTRHQAAKELVALKKAAKVGWDKLGIRDVDAQTVTEFAASTPVVQSKKPAKKKIPQAVQNELAKTVVTGAKESPNQAHARTLFEQKNWSVLFAFKQGKKKSWTALGFTTAEEETIKKNV